MIFSYLARVGPIAGKYGTYPRNKIEHLKKHKLTYKEIGEKMFCSARTVESYRDALFEKLGVKTRVALALYAVRIGLYKL